eukprot:767359-Hanusia_phi.AAC.2
MRQVDEALKWYNEALSTVSKVFGPDHPEVRRQEAGGRRRQEEDVTKEQVAHVHWNIALCYQTKGEVDASKRSPPLPPFPPPPGLQQLLSSPFSSPFLRRKLGWHNSWPFKFFSAATKKRSTLSCPCPRPCPCGCCFLIFSTISVAHWARRIVHEGKDFEAMVKHLNHGESLLAFDIFFSLLVVTQTTLLPPVPILSAQCIALIRSQLSTFSSRGSGRITSQPNELHRPSWRFANLFEIDSTPSTKET